MVAVCGVASHRFRSRTLSGELDRELVFRCIELTANVEMQVIHKRPVERGLGSISSSGTFDWRRPVR